MNLEEKRQVFGRSLLGTITTAYRHDDPKSAKDAIKIFDEIISYAPADKIAALFDTTFQNIDTFEITSGAMRMTDPCYDMDTWCAHTQSDVLNGTWRAQRTMTSESQWGLRVASLTAWHESAGETVDTSSWSEEGPELGVDSGQCGLFDLARFEAEHDCDYSNKQGFYRQVCDMTIYKTGHIVRGFGTVSSSGFGDGGYPTLLLRNADNKVIGVTIIYISDEEDEEDEEKEAA